MVSEERRKYYAVREGLDGKPRLLEEETGGTPEQSLFFKDELARMGFAWTPEEAIRLYMQSKRDALDRARHYAAVAWEKHQDALEFALQHGVEMTEEPE